MVLREQRLLLFFLSFILILFVGTRFETGDDWGEYTKVFDKIPLVSDLWNDNGMFLLFRMEPGYILFNSVIKSFGGSINEVFLLFPYFLYFKKGIHYFLF